jgi:N-acetylneuraminate synthase
MRWNSEIHIGEAVVSLADPTWFIADIAANHDGDLERAKALIWRAKEAGADCAKFQHFKADKIVSGVGFDQLNTPMAHQAKWERSVVEVYDAYHTRRDWTGALVETCKAADIAYMTTPYDFEALEGQLPFIPAVKIGSGDLTWHEMVAACAGSGKPVLLATGAAAMREVEAAVEVALTGTRDLVLMQCNTNYSGSEENFACVNLKVLQTFALRWPGMVLGLSDHTPGHAAVLGAVALGARVVEKHFTDDNARVGPDHAFALNPTTWRAMVDDTRRLEAALGTGVKVVEVNEQETVVVQRRAVRLRADLAAGAVLGLDDLEYLRPCPPDALEPWQAAQAVGRRLKAAKVAGSALTWDDLC